MRRIFTSPWFSRGMRLSVVVGFIAAGWYAWTVWELYSDDLDRSIKSELTYECAARMGEDELAPYTNEFGNINVKTLCVTQDDFFVSPDELEAVRNGTMEFGPIWEPFDWPGTAITGVFWAVLTMLATVAGLGVVSMARWVWGR